MCVFRVTAVQTTHGIARASDMFILQSRLQQQLYELLRYVFSSVYLV